MIAVGMSGAALLLVWWLHTSLLRTVDDAARQRAQDVASALDRGAVWAVVPPAGSGETVVQVIDRAGRIVAASPNVAGEPALVRGWGNRSTGGIRTVRNAPLGDNATYRVATVPARLGGSPVLVYAGLPTTGVDRSTAQLTRALGVGLPIVIAGLGGVAWLLVRRALRPVETLRRQTAEITLRDLQRRLAVPAGRDELARLAGTLNDLLTRLDATTSQQRQFIADAAHELRSPLAALRAGLEVSARHPAAAPWPDSAAVALGDAERLSRLVDDLVHLARLDAHPRLRRHPVDLDEIVFDEVRRVRQRTTLVVDESAVTAVRLNGDGDALARVVRNLLDNAIRHARHRVTVTLTRSERQARLIVCDDGPGIAPEHRQRVFERFTRLDDARSRDGGGSGLGLSIVRDVTLAHGGTVVVQDSALGARFVVELPTPQPGGAA